jgi:hypothetical protein
MLYTDLEEILVKVRSSLENDDIAGAVAAIEALASRLTRRTSSSELEDEEQVALLPRAGSGGFGRHPGRIG